MGTSYSPFWDNGKTSGGSYAPIGKFNRRYAIKRVANREGMRRFTALFNGLIGAASGSNVTATSKKITYTDGNLDGARTAAAVTSINRNTTAADVAALKEMTYNVKTRPSYPRDLSGNGGGSFA